MLLLVTFLAENNCLEFKVFLLDLFPNQGERIHYILQLQMTLIDLNSHHRHHHQVTLSARISQTVSPSVSIIYRSRHIL